MRAIVFLLILAGFVVFAQEEVLLYSECNLKITDYEFVDELNDLSPEKENAKIMILKLEGKAPKNGNLTCIPSLFNIQYHNEDNRPEISPSRAFGIRGKDRNGNNVEEWLTVESNFLDVSYLEYDKGSKITIYYAFDIPKFVKNFQLLAPINIDNKTL